MEELKKLIIKNPKKPTNGYIGYIYVFYNTVNKKLYIGKTTELYTLRFNEHKYNAFTKNIITYFYKALRKYGWATGINENYPFIARLPYDSKNLCKGCRIIIPAPLPLGEDELFVITDIKSDLDFPDCFICKVAPINEDRTDIPTNYENTNTNFLKVDL